MISFEYSKYTREKLYFKLKEKQNLRKFIKSLNTFIITPGEVEKYVGMMQSSPSDNFISDFNIKMNLFAPVL